VNVCEKGETSRTKFEKPGSHEKAIKKEQNQPTKELEEWGELIAIRRAD